MKKVSTFVMMLLIYLTLPVLVTVIFTGVTGQVVTEDIIIGRRINVKYKNVTKTVSLNEFVAYVLADRYKKDSEIELLKAESVMIRTDIVRLMGENIQMDSDDLNMNYKTTSQMENVWGDSFKENYELIKDCVAATGSKILTWQGNPINALYTEVSCGKTLSGKEELGENYGYLQSVDCPGDLESSEFLAVRVFQPMEWVKMLKKSYKDIGINEASPASDFQIVAKNNEGYVKKIQIGNVIMSGEKLALLANLNSPCMTIEKLENDIKITTKGVGNGYGVSLYSANIDAKAGLDYTGILEKYYSGVELVDE